MSEAKRLAIARILGPHGVKGAVKLYPLLEDPAMIGTLNGIEDESGKPVFLKLLGASGKALIAKLAGVETREAAEALARRQIFVARDALPALETDEFYAADLIGLCAEDEGGHELGRVVGVQDFGAGPLLEVRPAAGGPSVYLPFTAETVPEVDLNGGRLVLVPPPGLWPEQ